MRVEKNVPEIRFMGFSGEWVKEIIFNIAPLQRGFDLPKSEMKAGGTYPVVMSNGVNGSHDVFKAKSPGVITGRSGTIGNIHYIDVDYWPHNTALWVTNFHGNTPRFIYYLYVKLDLKRFGTGSGVPTLNRNDVHDQLVALPQETEEQTAIGNTFQKLDNLIKQHQQKHDKLSNIKKAMLEKMFPKPGENIPEIRFKGFSGEWEELCVGEIAKTSIGEFVKQTKQNPDSPYPVFNGGKSFTGHYDDYNNEGDKILVSARGANAGFVNYQKTRFWAGNSCYSIDVSSKEEHHTIFVYFSIKRTQHLFTDFQQAANIPSVSKADVEKFKFMSPKFAEQEAIGNYFQKLDALINQHQQQITKLNNIKQACLSKMFV